MRSDVTVINQAIIVALEEAACLPTDEQAMWLALFADNDDDPFYGAGSRLLEDGTVRHVITKQAWCGFDGWQ